MHDEEAFSRKPSMLIGSDTYAFWQQSNIIHKKKKAKEIIIKTKIFQHVFVNKLIKITQIYEHINKQVKNIQYIKKASYIVKK